MTANSQKSLLVITNLYPVPWAPNRASFNKQQFDLIAEVQPVSIIILLGWKEWLSHRHLCQSIENVKYCPYFYVPRFGRRLVPFFQWLSLLFCLPWIKRKSPSALLASWGFPDAVAAAMLNSKLKLPFFIKVHGTDVNENTAFTARSSLMKKWLNKAKVIFCASKALSERLEEVGLENRRLKVNYNGVNRDIFYPLEQRANGQSFIFVGSLIETKGCNELLSAFIEVTKKHPNATLDIIGEGPLKTALQEKITQCELKAKVRLLGSLPLIDVARAVRAANVLVLPSYREGVPNVLLESFASATPVIATDVGGIPEVVNDDVGLLVPAKSEKKLASAMVKAIETEWSAEKITTHACQFNWQDNVNVVLNELGKNEVFN